MSDVITDVDQITPDWLTRVLQKNGCLSHEKVTTVQKKSRQTITSIIYLLQLEYSAAPPNSAPTRLFLKISKPDFDSELSSRLGKRESEFYNVIAKGMNDAPLVSCYDAVYSPEAGKSHILLADLSETHFQTEWPLPPVRSHCEEVMDYLAKFHAFWWDHPLLGKSIGTFPSDDSVTKYIRDTEKRFAGFVDFLGDRLSADRRLLYEKILTSVPNVWRKRVREDQTNEKNFTLIHGDAHFWSFLYPRSDNDKIYIIDWQGWRIDTATDDLAYMIALHWYPERRRTLESDLITRYHDNLLAGGVINYDWNQCWYDYRLSVIGNLFIPVWQWSAKLWPGIWWPHLERAFLAFDDLECTELLESHG